MTVFLVFAGLVVLLLTGIPIFAALGLTATVILLLTEGSISSVADTVFAHLDKPLLTTIPLFVLMARIMVNLERRRVPTWLRTKRSQIADIRENLKAARAAEEAGDLKSASHAYVGLIRKYEYIRFETVFSLPLMVKTGLASGNGLM